MSQDGTVVACGSNEDGDLGIGGKAGNYSEPQTIEALAHVVELSAGDNTGMARLEDGEVYAWGDNRTGQVGNGATETKITKPVKVSLPEAAVKIEAGGDGASNGTSYAILADGELYAWGHDKNNQCLDGKTETN
ncbi:MAG TPA: hypothetical protein VKG82_06685 [Solirubrobacteraceae bacterium]|nr:hypothetical protein [Solirubrobacteraceae bacterium]HME05078.1 hypothetical protein [Solirubrobacteraceae bacterium]